MSVGGNSAYDGVTDLPPLVAEAVGRARAAGFDHSCAPEQGRLLAVLARGRAGGRVGETGTGHGVGLAWMLEAAGPYTSFVSIEADAGRAEASTQLFAGHRNVEILHGDWTELAARAPFDLFVSDGGGGKGKDGAPEFLDPAEWITPCGLLVMDDFVPAGAPEAHQHDAARQYWLTHPGLHATELRLAPGLATIVAVRAR